MDKRKALKKFSLFNSLDVREYWCFLWKEKHNEIYYPHGYGGNEVHLLKEKIDEYGIFAVLTALEEAVKRKMSIKMFCEAFFSYLLNVPDHRIHFFVSKFGGNEQKELYKQYLLLDSRWIKNAGDSKRVDELYNKLKEWGDKKE